MTNFYATMILSVLVAIAMGVLGYLASVILGIKHISLLGFVIATLFMAIIMGFFLIILTIITVLASHKFKLDPDNVTVPIVATLGDVATVGFLLVLIRFLQGFDGLIAII